MVECAGDKAPREAGPADGVNGIARVQAAIAHRPVLDRVPMGELVVDAKLRDAVVARLADTGVDRDAVSRVCEQAFFTHLGLDLICLAWPPPAEGDTAAVHRTVERYRDAGIFVFALIDGAFETHMAALGTGQFFLEAARAPDDCGRALGVRSHAIAEQMRRAVDAGVHGIFIADDIAYTTSTYVSPRWLQRYLAPCWAAQVDLAHRLGVPIFLHTDGNIRAVLEDIAAVGFDGLQGLEPAAGMDIGAIKVRFGDRLCLMGNLDPILLSPSVPGREVDAAGAADPLADSLADLFQRAAGGGGFIFGTASGLYGGMDPARVLRMYALARRIGAVGARA